MKKNTKHNILKTVDLSIGYSNKSETNYIAKNLNIDLDSGNLVCLIGKNGIGKSTLLRTLCNTQHKLKGAIFLDSQNLYDISASTLAKKLSLVLTEKIPESQLTVYELIALGRQPYTNWLGKLTDLDIAKIEEAIQLVKIESIKDKKNYELSDGQLQKVMIARALAQDTDIIILDEPTAHLDLHHKIEVFKILKSLVDTQNKTIILSTHEVNLAIQLADILWLMTPESFKTGTTDSLIKEKDLESLFPSNQVLFNTETKQFAIKK